MKTRQAITAAVLGLGIATIAGFSLQPLSAHASDDRARSSEVRQLRESGQILAMEDILKRSQVAQPGQVVEVELDREGGKYVYEVKIIDAADAVHKLEIDAASGEILRRKVK